jgi:hypothetical protein
MDAKLLENINKMNVKTVRNGEIKIYFFQNCGLIVKFDSWNHEVAIINISNDVTVFEYIEKVIKTKDYLIIIRDGKIYQAISNYGFVGVLVHGQELIRTYATYRKLKSLGKEVRLTYA